ncbi:MAG: hypothetical protein ABFS45_13460 [Pseudomonadota bacterium]
MSHNLRNNSGWQSKSRDKLLIGLLTLLIGSLIYIVDRPPEQIYFIDSGGFPISLNGRITNIFGSIGNNLPGFIHVFSFSLMTSAVIGDNKFRDSIICMSWFVVDVTAELFQKFNSWTVIIPDWFKGIPYIENTKSYFHNGTFDTLDLVAIGVGSISAIGVLHYMRKRSR